MKFYGEIGYGVETEVKPGVWKTTIIKRQYSGDVIRLNSRWQTSGNVNDDMTINNQFSIIADPFANENFANMKYIEYMKTRWKITSVEVQYPRIIINVGGVYRG